MAPCTIQQGKRFTESDLFKGYGGLSMKIYLWVLWT